MLRKYRFLTLLLILVSAAALAVKGDIQQAEAGWALIESGALLVDVRSPEEYAEGHIEGSVNVPHTETDKLASLIGGDKDRSVVVYCRSGHRAGMAKTALERLGYTHIFNATGYEALLATAPHD